MRASLFYNFWQRFHDRPLEERKKYFESLDSKQRQHLIDSFFSEKWHELFICNIIDQHLDEIKHKYGYDLFEINLSARTKNKVFLIQKSTWDHILDLIMPYSKYYNTQILFGGLSVKPWGRRKQFYIIKRR